MHTERDTREIEIHANTNGDVFPHTHTRRETQKDTKDINKANTHKEEKDR